MHRIRRFEYCGKDLFAYIENVLNLLDKEKKEEFLRDESLQIISSDRLEMGFQATFSKPVISIIYINTEKIREIAPTKGASFDDCLLFAIAHEIAHYFTRDCGAFLLEKEANDWLRIWANGYFDNLIDQDGASINEEKGYKEGYESANEQHDIRLREMFSPFLKLRNIREKREQVIEIDKLINEVKNGIDKKDQPYHYLKGFAFGMMKRVWEIDDKIK